MAKLNRQDVTNLLDNSPLMLTGKSGSYSLVNHYSNTTVFEARTLPEIRQHVQVLLGR